MNSIIIIADDHPTIHKGLKILFDEFTPNTKVLHAFTFFEVLELLVDIEMPVVLLLDINLPGFLGVSSVENLLNRYPKSRIIMFSQEREDIFSSVYKKVGVYGYLQKNVEDSEIKAAVSAALRNEPNPNANIEKTETASFMSDSLTEREKQIHELLKTGISLKEAAMRLNISTSTVATYKKRIFAKLNITTNSEYYRL